MIGYATLLIIAGMILLIYWRLTKNYKMAELLISELKEKAQFEEIDKVRMKVKVYEPDTVFTTATTVTIYILNQGILFFQGKDESEHSTIWLYHNSSNKMFFKNCQSRGEIISIKEDAGKTIYEVEQTTNLLPFYLAKTPIRYELYKNERGI
jgi:hypothetical protein